MRQIPKIHTAYMVGIILELQYRQKDLLSNSVLFLQIGANINLGRLKSGIGHILDSLFTNLRQFPKTHLKYMVGIT